MKKSIAAFVALGAVIAAIGFPSQAASAGTRAKGCEKLIHQSRRKDGGTDYKFSIAGTANYAVYHVQRGDPAPNPICVGQASVSTQIQSGFQAVAPTGVFDSTNSDYNAPQHFYDSTCHANQSMAAWSGIESSAGLIQAGVVRLTIGTYSYSGAFWEIFRGPLDTGSAQEPLTGTLLYDKSEKYNFVVTVVSDTLIHFGVLNITKAHTTLSMDYHVAGNALQYKGSVADAVQERFQYAGFTRVTKYEDFTGSGGGGSSLFSGMLAHRAGGSNVNFNSMTNQSLVMHDRTTNTDIDTPGRMSSTDAFYTNRKAGVAGCGTDETLG